MKRSLSILLACAALAAPAFAQQPKADEHAAHHPTSAPTSGAAPMTEGEVRKIDKAAGKVTLKHGEIASLGMPRWRWSSP